MVALVSLIVLFLNFVTVYNDIKIELRNNHSRTYLKKNGKGLLSSLFFVPFVSGINKFKYTLLIANYILPLIGFIFQFLLLFNLMSDNNLIIIGFAKFMVVYAVTLFIYKLIFSRIFAAISENSSVSTVFVLAVILVYIVIFIIVPVYKGFVNQ